MDTKNKKKPHWEYAIVCFEKTTLNITNIIGVPNTKILNMFLNNEHDDKNIKLMVFTKSEATKAKYTPMMIYCTGASEPLPANILEFKKPVE